MLTPKPLSQTTTDFRSHFLPEAISGSLSCILCCKVCKASSHYHLITSRIKRYNTQQEMSVKH